MARKAKKKNSVDPTPAADPGKKAKKKIAAPENEPMDVMSQCVVMCQEKRWREALMLCRQAAVADDDAEGEGEPYFPLAGVQTKIEFSLRRQMAASLIQAAKNMLAKEYLLDVGE